MKHLRTILTALFVAVVQSLFAETQTFAFEFNEADFDVTTDNAGVTHITSLNKIASYGEAFEPALPFFSKQIAIPNHLSYESATITMSKHLVGENVDVALNPIAMTTNALYSEENTGGCEIKTYPASNFEYVSTEMSDDEALVYVRYCPFVYDAVTKELYIVDRMDVTFALVPRVGSEDSRGVQKIRGMNNIGIGFEPIPLDSMPRVDSMTVMPIRYYEDYLIITNEELKPAFETIALWKNTKGVKTSIVTVESIYGNKTDVDKPLLIKKYIARSKRESGIKYVLLGGDDAVVPVRYCTAHYNDYKGEQVPSDLYYACFDTKRPSLLAGAESDGFSMASTWDLNGNGIYGEIEDEVKMTPSVYVSRLPVNTYEEVMAYTHKLLKYEREPVYQHRMLSGGMTLNSYWKNGRHLYSSKDVELIDPLDPDTHSDSEVESDKIYSQVIQPWWTGQRMKFFDTGTSFQGDRSYEFTGPNLQMQLANGGYDFVSIFAHGYDQNYIMEDGRSYDRSHAASLVNPYSCLVTTVACLTNAFDRRYDPLIGYISAPCLSEAFIRNPENGVVAYLGCSREGLVGASHEYESLFYYYLFSDELQDKNFARVVASAKMARIAESQYHDPEKVKKNKLKNNYRWIQYGLNPIGDPEMPIYTYFPNRFYSFSVNSTKSNLEIETGVDGCRICIKGLGSSSHYSVYDESRSLTIPLSKLPEQYSICVTKQNYIPLVYTVETKANGQIKVNEVKSTEQLLQKDMGLASLDCEEYKITSCTTTSGAEAVFSVDMQGLQETAEIKIADVMTGQVKKTVSIYQDEDEVKVNIADLRAGVHVATLVVNGSVKDTNTFIKK